MKVIIETTNSSQPITVKNLKYISVVDEDDNAEIIKDNFEAFLLLDELSIHFCRRFNSACLRRQN